MGLLFEGLISPYLGIVVLISLGIGVFKFCEKILTKIN